MTKMEKFGAFLEKTLLEENFKKFTIETYLDAYWKVLDESKANKWAVRFANRNPQKVKELEEIISVNWHFYLTFLKKYVIIFIEK